MSDDTILPNDLFPIGTRVEYDGPETKDLKGVIVGLTEMNGEDGYVVTSLASWGTCFLRCDSVRPASFTLPWESRTIQSQRRLCGTDGCIIASPHDALVCKVEQSQGDYRQGRGALGPSDELPEDAIRRIRGGDTIQAKSEVTNEQFKSAVRAMVRTEGYGVGAYHHRALLAALQDLGIEVDARL